MKDELTAALAAFLRARLAEDEELARQAADSGNAPTWDRAADVFLMDGLKTRRRLADRGVPDALQDAAKAHAARHDPARSLRAVEATRGVLAMYDQMIADAESSDLATRHTARMAITVLTPVMCHLARAWSDHPDYQADAWKPIA